MNASPTAAASHFQADRRSVSSLPATPNGDRFAVAFKAGLDLSPLKPRQRLIARVLLQRLTGKM